MTVKSLIELVDSIAPNSCSKEQKLYWYNQCESIIKNKAKPSFRYLETIVISGVVKLPEGYDSEDIEAVYLNGKLMDKLDFRSGFVKRNLSKAKLGVVLKEHHTEIKEKLYEGDIFFDGDKITMPGHNFSVGDRIKIECILFDGEVTVTDVKEDELLVNRLFEVNDCEGKAALSLDIEVLLKSPYDKLYIDYILAQMDYYNKDYEGYNNNSYLFNELLDELVRKNSGKAPGTKHMKMHSIW